MGSEEKHMGPDGRFSVLISDVGTVIVRTF